MFGRIDSRLEGGDLRSSLVGILDDLALTPREPARKRTLITVALEEQMPDAIGDDRIVGDDCYAADLGIRVGGIHDVRGGDETHIKHLARVHEVRDRVLLRAGKS